VPEVALPVGISVEGLRETARAFDRFSSTLGKDLAAELLIIAEHVGEVAVFIAHSKGLDDPEHAPDGGGLIQSIHAKATRRGAYIVSSARRRSPGFPSGFNYPAMYEYGGSEVRRAHGADWKIRSRSTAGIRLIANYGVGSGHLGPRAFLEPAVEQSDAYINAAAVELVDRVMSKSGFGGGLL
jgi:hypothetical protein